MSKGTTQPRVQQRRQCATVLSATLPALGLLLLSGCLATAPTLGGGSEGAAVTGSAGGKSAQGANSQLESCDAPLGTLSVYEDRRLDWWSIFRRTYPDLGSTIPVLRLMIQQSNCFVVVDRGDGLDARNTERELAESGEMREGSNFGKGQVVAADYTMQPSIQISQKGTGGLGGLVGGMLGNVGAAVAGGLSKNEASTTLLLTDNRSSVQVAAAHGSASNYDISLFGGFFRRGAVGVGGYSDTPQGRNITAAFADSYNQMVKSLRNYQAQEVEGGLGKGGNLGIAN